jgi:hypothetical protein
MQKTSFNIEERDNNGLLSLSLALQQNLFQPRLLFVAGLAGRRPFALALVAAYAKFVSGILIETGDFAGRLGMAQLAVLERFLVHFVRERHRTHLGRECNSIRRHGNARSKENKGQC